jgi:molybdate transport system substrate-binding protein
VNRLNSVFAVFVGAALMLPWSASSQADEVTLAAGAGFRRPIVEVATAFEKQSGHKILQVYGHMGQVIAQARESGRVSLVCGDRAVLDAAKGVSFDRMARLGIGKLVVAYRKGLTLAKAEDLTRDDIKRIGIPDQANAIYGKAGRQFLSRTGLAAKIDPKLVPVATVPQVTSYVASGEVDAGFVNATDAIGMGSNIGGFVEVDPKLYDTVEVACGVVASAKDQAAADGFTKFIATEQARAILNRYGL